MYFVICFIMMRFRRLHLFICIHVYMYAIHTLAPRAQIYVFLYNCIQIYKICQSFIKVFYYTKVTILPALFTNPYCIAGLLHTKRERKQFCHSHSLSQRYLIYFTLFTVRVHLSDHSYFQHAFYRSFG